uniref:Uncharacterized protein n=2 Tax=Ananas comosus TaxID=4615 RepID=A0A6V7QHX6_ANACO|nr:unnamed protein product [Ananas comosus var. bracteatus]
MGVSFKISRIGSRYRPTPRIPTPAAEVVSVVELEASLALNLFPDGFFIGIPTEGMLLPLLGGVPVLHPYDRSSKTLFSAIENGWLPGDILDDIPCKYLNGTIICEVWDYRSCMTKLGDNEPSGDEFPKLKKVNLRMGMENVVKDMLSIADDSWTYNDLLQAESQIIKALRPRLNLDPKPLLNRLCRNPVPKMLDLGIQKKSTEKHKDTAETNYASSLHVLRNVLSSTQEKNLVNNCSLEQEESSVVNCSLPKPHYTASVSSSGPVLDKTLGVSCTTQKTSLHNGKQRISAEPPSPPLKRPKQEPLEMVSSHINSDQSKMLPRQKQLEASNMQYLSNEREDNVMPVPKILKQGPVKFSNVKEEPTDLEKKIVRGPLNFELEDNQTKGAPCSSYPASAGIGIHKDKAAIVSTDSIEKVPISSAPKTSVVQANHSKKRQKKPEALIEVAAGTCNTSNDNSSMGNTSTMQPTVETNVDLDPALHRKFSTIVTIIQRHGLDNKKAKVDKYLSRVSLSSCFLLPDKALRLEDTEECGSLTENTCMSKYLIGGSRNACKTRILTFQRVRFFFRDTGIPFWVDESRCKLVLLESEEPHVHEVAVEIIFDQGKRFNIAILPSSHHADVFAAQFTRLMKRDGYELLNDQLQRSSSSIANALCGSSVAATLPNITRLPYATPASNHLLHPAVPFGNNLSTLNLQQFPLLDIQSLIGMPPPFLSLIRPQQLETLSNLSSMSQQQSDFNNPLPYTPKALSDKRNARIGNVFINNPSDIGILLNRGQSYNQGTHLMSNNMPIQNFSHRNDGMIGDASLLNQALGRSCLDQFKYKAKAPIVLPERAAMNLCTNNYDLWQQFCAQQKEKLSQLTLQQKEQLLLLQSSLSLKQDSPALTRINQPLSVSCSEVSMQSRAHHVNGHVATVGSPQISSQTIGSGSSVTSTPVELGAPIRGSEHGKEIVEINCEITSWESGKKKDAIIGFMRIHLRQQNGVYLRQNTSVALDNEQEFTALHDMLNGIVVLNMPNVLVEV